MAWRTMLERAKLPEYARSSSAYIHGFLGLGERVIRLYTTLKCGSARLLLSPSGPPACTAAVLAFERPPSSTISTFAGSADIAIVAVQPELWVAASATFRRLPVTDCVWLPRRRLVSGDEEDSAAADGAPYQRSVASVSGSVESLAAIRKLAACMRIDRVL